jgi:hypothetical protein
MGRAMRLTACSREMKQGRRANGAGITVIDLVQGIGRPLPLSRFRGSAPPSPEECESEEHQ